MARKNRITLLSDKEISDTYDRPLFCDELRGLYFSLRKTDHDLLSGYKTTNKTNDLLKLYPKGNDTFCQLQKYLENEKIVIPTYRTCQDIFTEAFAKEEARLSLLVNNIPKETQNKLGSLIKNTNDTEDNGIMKLSIIKQDQKDFQYTVFTQEIEKARGISDL